MKLKGDIAVVKSMLRVARKANKRLLWIFFRNFILRNMRGMARFEKRMAKGKPFFPAFVMISLTNECNLSCSGCWVAQTVPPKRLSLSQLDGVIESSKRNGSYFFGILGGEPLLYPGLFEIFEKHSDCYFQLFTNGLELSEDIAKRIKKVGNVTPLISIEGLEKESDKRRNDDNVFKRTLTGLDNCIKEGIITGAAASICKGNFEELVSRDYLEFLASKNVAYMWYYIYRPVGANPNPENALTEEQILEFRKFLVDQRLDSPVMIIETYWDSDGKALCPGAMGMSHHIGPSGAVEFCPPLQVAKEFINEDGSNLEDIFNNSVFLKDLRELTSKSSRGCILLENPELLSKFSMEQGANDSNIKQRFLKELESMRPLPGHNIPGKEIPEKSRIYRFIKKRYFFGFGAYG
jgi:MoaA/NifB/PqqE/SkfB family radical SAM enzyme